MTNRPDQPRTPGRPSTEEFPPVVAHYIPDDNQPAQTQPSVANQPKQNSNWLVWVLSILLVLAVGLPLGYFVGQRSSSGGTNDDVALEPEEFDEATDDTDEGDDETVTVTRKRERAPKDDESDDATEEEAEVPADEILCDYATTDCTQADRGNPRLQTVDVRSASHPESNYDRVVFEFSGKGTPGVDTTYSDDSGLRVTISGTTKDAGAQYGHSGALGVSSGNVEDVDALGHYDGESRFYIHLDGKRRYQVRRLTGPPRIAIDFMREDRD